jgi:hypothetical protein
MRFDEPVGERCRCDSLPPEVNAGTNRRTHERRNREEPSIDCPAKLAAIATAAQPVVADRLADEA